MAKMKMDQELYKAIVNGEDAKVRKLIEASADKSALLNAQGNTMGAGVNGNAVTLAARFGHVGLIKLFREHGAVVEKREVEFAIKKLADQTKIEVVKQALEAKVTIIEQPELNEEVKSPHVVQEGEVKTVEKSKKKGMFSVFSRLGAKFSAAVAPLMQGNTGIRIEEDRPPSRNSEQAMLSEKDKVKKALRNYHNTQNNKADEAVITNYKGSESLGSIIDEEHSLSKAARNGNLHAVKFLKEKGASIDHSNILGTTPLMSAIETGYSDVTVYLVNQKANLNLQDSEGETALMKEIHRISNNNRMDKEQYAVVNLLIKNGADTSLANVKSQTALMIAKEKLGKNSQVFLDMKDAFRQAKAEIGGELMYKRWAQIKGLGKNKELNEEIAKQKAHYNQIGKSIRATHELPWSSKVKDKKDSGHGGR